MKSWSDIPRTYPMSTGDYPSLEEPPALVQQNGFKPSFIGPDGDFSAGDPVEYKHLNFIFRDLYKKAAEAERRLNTLEGRK